MAHGAGNPWRFTVKRGGREDPEIVQNVRYLVGTRYKSGQTAAARRGLNLNLLHPPSPRTTLRRTFAHSRTEAIRSFLIPRGSLFCLLFAIALVFAGASALIS